MHGWTIEEMELLADRLLDAWADRQTCRIVVRYGERWQKIWGLSDGDSILAPNGECLVTRLDPAPALVHGDRCANRCLITSKAYPHVANTCWLHYCLASRIGRRDLESEIVRMPDRPGFVDAESLRIWWRAQEQWERQGIGETYLSMVGQLLDHWLAGRDGDYTDGLHDLAWDRQSVYAHGECVLTRDVTSGVILLSGVRYRRGTHRLAVRDTLRYLLADRDVPFREVRPVGRQGYTEPRHLRSGWRETGLRAV